MQLEPMSESGKRLICELRMDGEDSKIALPDNLKEKRMHVYVVKVQVGSKFNVGDEVFFDNNTVAINIEEDGKKYLAVRESDIVSRKPVKAQKTSKTSKNPKK